MKKNWKALSLLLILSMAFGAYTYLTDSDPKGGQSILRHCMLIFLSGLLIWMILAGFYWAVIEALKGLITKRELFLIVCLPAVIIGLAWMIKIDTIGSDWDSLIMLPLFVFPPFVLLFVSTCISKFLWRRLRT